MTVCAGLSCGRPFSPSRFNPGQRFCSKRCKDHEYEARHRGRHEEQPVPAHVEYWRARAGPGSELDRAVRLAPLCSAVLAPARARLAVAHRNVLRRRLLAALDAGLTVRSGGR